ncbi:MAG: alkane 1-monooxygenase, partial [Silicimonas sp.]|nr:alkane 1-monooxygenase [Silicimonas sp.]
MRTGFLNALPFWGSLGLIPLAWIGAAQGGWTVSLVFLGAWILVSLIDLGTGLNTDNADTEKPDTSLFWHRLITLVWAPVQIVTVFGIIAFVTASGHLGTSEIVGLSFSLGILSGAIGIVYA